MNAPKIYGCADVDGGGANVPVLRDVGIRCH